MCGILGTNLRGYIVDEPEVAMSLSHRGPDSSKSYCDGNMGFRISRLAIVNSDFDDQPSFGCNGRFAAILNGEIYNYKELALKLEEVGHNLPVIFSDAAILPHMFEEYGHEFATKLDGMFAIAIWDHELSELTIYRDSIGIKPMYYKISDGQIYFASEIHAITKMIDQVAEIDLYAIEKFSSYNLISSPNTIYKDIYSLVPGTYLRFNLEKVDLVRWHNFNPNRKSARITIEDSASKLEDLLIDSISNQLNHGESNALLLSGGVDSSLIAAIAKKRLSKNLETYHLAYESDIEDKQIESKIAREVADHLDLRFHEMQISSKQYFEQIDNALDAFAQPFGGVTSTYFISKYISERHKVCLTGDGADELFGSYTTVQLAARSYYGEQELKTTKLSQQESNLVEYIKENQTKKEWDKKNQHFYPLQDEILKFKATTDVFNFALMESQLQLLPDQVLLFSDHLGMAHGLEIRPPFLSSSIIRYSRELPLEYLIDSNGTTKYVLKQLALRYFDANFVHRKKEGFMLPLNQWMKRDEAKNWVNLKLTRYLDSRNELLDRGKIRLLFEDFYARKNNDFFRIYRLAVLMHFLRNHEK